MVSLFLNRLGEKKLPKLGAVDGTVDGVRSRCCLGISRRKCSNRDATPSGDQTNKTRMQVLYSAKENRKRKRMPKIALVQVGLSTRILIWDRLLRIGPSEKSNENNLWRFWREDSVRYPINKNHKFRWQVHSGDPCRLGCC